MEVPAIESTAGGSRRKVVVVMDTTYFGRKFGVLVILNLREGEILYRDFVKYETIDLYVKGLEKIRGRGYEIEAVACDGRKGLLRQIGFVPVQMCQFHQVAIVTRYLTRRPKTPASQELRELTLKLTKTGKEDFAAALNGWHEKWEKFLAERTVNPETKESHYTHKRLRSAYKSLKTNLPWLFTFSDHPGLGIPNTTNSLDGLFSDLKNKLRCHNGLTESRRKKFIDEFFKV